MVRICFFNTADTNYSVEVMCVFIFAVGGVGLIIVRKGGLNLEIKKRSVIKCKRNYKRILLSKYSQRYTNLLNITLTDFLHKDYISLLVHKRLVNRGLRLIYVTALRQEVMF